MSKLGCCANVSRFSLFIINLIFMAVGLVVLVLGIVAVVTARKDGASLGGAFTGGAGIFIACGSISILVSITGNIAVILKLRPLLVIYGMVVMMVVLLEIVGVVLLLVYRSNLTEAVEDASLQEILQYRVHNTDPLFNQAVNDRVDLLQNTFGCCGFHNASDWILKNPLAVMQNGGRPPHCEQCKADGVKCKNFNDAASGISFNTTASGCSNPQSRPFTIFAIVIGVVAILFALFQVFGIVLSFGLCCCISIALGKQDKGELLEL